jgi:hypothetical protein
MAVHVMTARTWMDGAGGTGTEAGSRDGEAAAGADVVGLFMANSN